MLFHLHIPKTGGTTLHGALSSRIPSERRVLVLAGENTAAGLSVQIGHAELVSGHLTWAATAAFSQTPAVLTILRDPIERTLSQYSYFRERAADGVFLEREQRTAEEALTRTLNDVLVDESSLLRSSFSLVQVDYLSSVSVTYEPLDKKLDDVEIQRRVDLAVRNLESCAWVATTETLDRDLQTLAFQLRWDPLGIPTRHLITKHRVTANSLSARALRELERLVEADQMLHRRARSLADGRHHSMVEHLLAERLRP